MISPPKAAPERAASVFPREDSLDIHGTNARLRIYIGEDRRHGDKPLHEAIVYKARQSQIRVSISVIRVTYFGNLCRLRRNKDGISIYSSTQPQQSLLGVNSEALEQLCVGAQDVDDSRGRRVAYLEPNHFGRCTASPGRGWRSHRPLMQW